MESRAFIKHAATLNKTIQDFRNTIGTAEDLRIKREAVQKEINQLFSGLHNPTLPSAYRLRDNALRNGFSVDTKVQHQLGKYEYITG